MQNSLISISSLVSIKIIRQMSEMCCYISNFIVLPSAGQFRYPHTCKEYAKHTKFNGKGLHRPCKFVINTTIDKCNAAHSFKLPARCRHCRPAFLYKRHAQVCRSELVVVQCWQQAMWRKRRLLRVAVLGTFAVIVVYYTTSQRHTIQKYRHRQKVSFV